MRRKSLIAAVVLLSLLGTLMPASSPVRAAGIPVIDAANLAQAVIDFIKRLFEIAQRVVQIYNQVQMLDYWLYHTLKMEEIPYRVEILEFLELQGELMREFDALQGQYQAISHNLEEATAEFDITFPGWRAMSELAEGVSIRIQSEGGEYELESPAEYYRYQSARVLQGMRQSMASMGDHQTNLRESQLHLQELKEIAGQVEGHEQIMELQTSFTALSAEQLIALRESLAATDGAANMAASHQLNREMQTLAEQEAAVEELRRVLIAEFGVLAPEHTGSQGVAPFPAWVIP